MNKKFGYQDFLNLPEESKTSIEESLVLTCKNYFDNGDSIAVSITKTHKDSGAGKGFVEKVIRNNSMMKDLFKVHRQQQLSRSKGFN